MIHHDVLNGSSNGWRDSNQLKLTEKIGCDGIRETEKISWFLIVFELIYSSTFWYFYDY